MEMGVEIKRNARSSRSANRATEPAPCSGEDPGGGISPNTIEFWLRSQYPAIILRLEEDKALIDLRMVFPAREKELLEGSQKGSRQSIVVSRQKSHHLS
jgi:hypothetical protein